MHLNWHPGYHDSPVAALYEAYRVTHVLLSAPSSEHADRGVLTMSGSFLAVHVMERTSAALTAVSTARNCPLAEQVSVRLAESANP